MGGNQEGHVLIVLIVVIVWHMMVMVNVFQGMHRDPILEVIAQYMNIMIPIYSIHNLIYIHPCFLVLATLTTDWGQDTEEDEGGGHGEILFGIIRIIKILFKFIIYGQNRQLPKDIGYFNER